jgi:hypothetical protein
MTSTTSRRALLTAAAALPVLTVPALASAEPDPIFAAIERCRKAYEAHGAACTALGAYEETQGFLRTNEHSKFEELEDAAGDASAGAIRNLCLTVPTSADGLCAVVNYFLDEADEYFLNVVMGEDDDGSTGDAFMRSLRTFAERLAARAAVRA